MSPKSVLQTVQLRRQNGCKFKKVTNSERSEGPAFSCTGKKQVLRFAQDDNLDLGVGRSRTLPQRADLKIANTAPCASAITDMRPTPSIVIGGRKRLAPIPLAFAAVASTSSTIK